jgi:DNA-binding NtrC family response regulator
MKVENKIVLVDDEKVNLEYHQRILSDFQTIAFLDASKALEYCTKNSFDILIADLKMPIMSGLDLIKEIKTVKDDFISILLTAYTETEYLVDAVNSNAIYQYLVKPCEPKRMIATVQKGFEAVLAKRKKQEEEIVLQEENLKLRKENTELRFSAKSPLEALVGFNPMILKIKEQIKSFSLSDHPVLISGEEGTGKDICAQAIHELSPRRDEQIITVNCSAIPENLLEEELFGTAPEANNLGVKEKKGFVRMAHKGTLYLENVEVLPSTFQAKLLRLLQYGSFFSQGATSEETVDIRMIFASRQNLYEMARSDEFRKDLFYQIANLHIKMPPLRERREDILPHHGIHCLEKGCRIPQPGRQGQRPDCQIRLSWQYPGTGSDFRETEHRGSGHRQEKSHC